MVSDFFCQLAAGLVEVKYSGLSRYKAKEIREKILSMQKKHFVNTCLNCLTSVLTENVFEKRVD